MERIHMAFETAKDLLAAYVKDPYSRAQLLLLVYSVNLWFGADAAVSTKGAVCVAAFGAVFVINGVVHGAYSSLKAELLKLRWELLQQKN